MSRPSISVVVPFAGDAAQALVAVALLRSLELGPEDERILADNCGAVAAATHGVRVVPARGERSPAHARNAGAAVAAGEWLLFLDADTRAPADLLDRYFADPVAGDVGALAGEITGAPGARTLAARYGASRNFLSQSAHLAHPFRPRAAAANLLVRREAFAAAAGFAEGVRAGEDTDFAWRLQELGWRLELRPGAVVEHEYRSTVAELRRQWRAYAAGRRWLAERHPGFRPEPAAARALRRLGGRGPGRLSPASTSRSSSVPASTSPSASPPRAASPSSDVAGQLARRAPEPSGPLERIAFLALDVVLAAEELVGLRSSNRASGDR